MKAPKKLGIWMDHSSAHIMELTTCFIKTKIIESKLVPTEKMQNPIKSENLMHHKEQQQQSEYYKKLGEVIKNYEEVILFGPTDAKVELVNVLNRDQRFSKIRIDLEQTGKMTKNQQNAFVRLHFSNF